MQEQESDSFSIKSVDFIFRHPWTALFTFLIVANIFHAYATTIPKQYNTSAILSFETTSGTTTKKDLINEKKDAADKVLSGANIEAILSDALKDEPPSSRLAKYNDLSSVVMNPRSGIRLLWKSKETTYLLTIAFAYRDRTLSFNTVKSAMDLIIKESQQKAAKELEANVVFLSNQVNFYKAKLDETDKAIEEIKTELVKRFPELSESERELLTKSSGSANISQDDEVKKFEIQDSAITKLKGDLDECQQQRDTLQASLDNGTFMTQQNMDNMNKKDLFLTEYAKVTAAKELEIASLLSRGYTEDHPQVVQLRSEVEQLKEIRRSRMKLLRTGGPGTSEYEEVKENVQFEIGELDIKIAFLKDSISRAEKEKVVATTQLKSRESKGSDIKDMASRLVTLKSEKGINENYYLDMKKKLADAELKYRSEKENLGFKIIVLQPPVMPDKTDSSNTITISFLGFIIAVLTGIGTAYISDIIVDPITSAKELESLVGAPVLSVVNRISTSSEIMIQHKHLKYTAIATAIFMLISRVIIVLIFSGRT